MINARFFLPFMAGVFFYLWTNVCGAQTGVATCDFPAGIAKDFHVLLQTCVQPISMEELPELMAKEAGPSHPDNLWVAVHVNSAETQSKALVLSLGIPDAHRITVWQIDNNGSQKLLRLDEDSSFYERPLLNRQLQINVELAPRQKTEWIIFYRTHSKTALHVELSDPQLNLLNQSRYDVGNGFMFGVMLLLIVLLVLLVIFYHADISFLFYSLLVVSNIFFVAQLQGYTFAYLWPYAPRWNMNAPLLINVPSLSIHCLFVIKYIQLSWRYPRLYKIHLLLLALSIGALPIQFIHPTEEIFGFLITLYSVLAVVTAGVAVRDRLPSAKVYFLGTLFFMIFSAILFPMAVLWKNIFPTINALTYPKVGVLLESAFFAVALINRLIEYNRRQNELRLKRLAETEQLLRSEQARAEALALAEKNQLQLASASHDISQPLASIRFAMSALRFSEDQSKATQHIDKTLSYAQTLLKDILDQSRTDWGLVAEKISLPLLFDQLEQEFKSQAQIKKIQLTVIYSRLECVGSNLIIYRILNNLVANAIRYTPKGRVVLGVRRRAQGIELQVGDTGSGIPPSLMCSLMQPFQQGEQSQQGYGLGLFIVKSLCFQSGYHFSVTSKQSKGTLFSVYIPFVAD